ncbi:MAG: inverse autotransporter beta domain-containing protein [Candidatus Porifericomitaceae bacterium WSBS_2022_MAG_OTU9]
MVSAADEVNVVRLPVLVSTADDSGSSSAVDIGTSVQQRLEARGRNLLTPDGVAAALTRFEGSAGNSSAVAAVGAELAQSVIDAGLQRIEQQAGHHFFRTLNLNWTPGFNGREDLYQIDAMLSLHDGERNSLMTQLGLQGRNGEAGANAGLVLRTRAFADSILGLNVFYDYLSDPDVSRWSAGMELKGRWLGISSNIYIGMDEETSGSEILYSPDGWDVELSGHVPELPWLEYSGRYYNWDRELSSDLEGQDYRLTLRPVPLFDLSLRYDNAQDGDSGFGIETQLSYEFGRPMSEQLSYQQVATPASSWGRRFERVRREYEQRVQRRSSATRTSVTVTVPVGGSSVVAQIGNLPAGATQVVVSGGIRLGNSLTRAAPGAPAVRIHGGNCHVVGIANATCTFTTSASESSGVITIANLQPGNYNFSASFQNAVSSDWAGRYRLACHYGASGHTASVSVDNAAIAEDGGIATVTVTLGLRQATSVTVNLTRSGTATIVTDYSQTGLTAGTDPAYSIVVPATMATATFTLTAVDDTMVDDDETVIFTIASVTGYTPASGSSAVTVTITDDDDPPTASIYIGTAGTQAGTIAEAGTTSTTVTVALDPAPTTAVTVNLTRSGTATIVTDYSQTGLTAGTDPAYSIVVSAGDTTATFTLTAVDDSMDNENETAVFTIAAASSATDYTVATGEAATVVTVTITDVPPVASVYIGAVSTQTATITETGGGIATVTVALSSSAITGGVAVNLMRNSADTATIGTGNDYTYTASGITASTDPAYSIVVPAGDTTATFTLTAEDDAVDEDDETAEFTVVAGTGYTIETGAAATVTVTIVDNDTRRIVSTGTSSFMVREGDTSTYTIVLNSEPTTGTVTITPTSGDTDIATVTPATLSFSTSDWDTPQTVTVAGAENDASTDDGSTTITYAVSAAGNDYASVALADQPVTVSDNDGLSIISTGTSSFMVREGGTSTYTLALNTQPTDTVTINLTTNDNSIVRLSSSTPFSAALLFTTSDWATPKTVTVTGVVDMVIDHTRTTAITHAVSGGGYDAVTLAPQPVAVSDDTNTANAPPFFSVAACSAPASTPTACIYISALPVGTMSASVGITSAQGTDGVGLMQGAGGSCTATELRNASCVVSGIGISDALTITGLTVGRTYMIGMAFFNTANAMGTELASEQLPHTAVAAGSDAANAGLSNLQISGAGSAMLTPAFEANTIRYSLVVANDVTSITVTPTTAVTGAMVTVQGEAVTNAMPSGGITLPEGLTVVDVLVVSSDGNTRITYGISVTRASLTEPPSGPVLSGLNVYPLVNGAPVTSRPQVYTPAFSVAEREYRVFAQADVNALGLVMSVPDGAAITSFVATTTGMSAATPLGDNVYGLGFGGLTLDHSLGQYRVGFSISDGTDTKTYEIIAVVAATLSDLSFHSDVDITGGGFQFGTVVPMTPAFSPEVTSYTVTVPAGTDLNAQVRVPRSGIAVYATSSLPQNRGIAGPRNMLATSRDIVIVGDAGYVIEVIEGVDTDGTTLSTYTVTFTE